MSDKIVNTVSFSVDFHDELGRPWQGTFEEAKCVLSASEESQIGRVRRQILGPIQSETAGDANDFYYAQAQAEVGVRCKADATPAWWQKAGGADLPRSVILHVFLKMNEAIAEFLKAIEEKVAKAKGELRTDRDKRNAQDR